MVQRSNQTDMKAQLCQALAMEQKARKFLWELKEQILCDVKSAGSMPSVQPSDLPVTCAVVSLSSLYRYSLAPSTYIPSVQTDAVRRKLLPKQTVLGVKEALHEMVETQAVQFSGKDRVLLNKHTLAALIPWNLLLNELEV